MNAAIRIGALISGGGTNLQAIIDACESGTIDGKMVFVGPTTRLPAAWTGPDIMVLRISLWITGPFSGSSATGNRNRACRMISICRTAGTNSIFSRRTRRFTGYRIF